MSALARVLDALIGAYQRVLSPLFPARCRFHPTCSEYAREAVRTHGARRGVWLTARRIGRCHPWHEGGLDPVPAAKPTVLTQESSV